MVHREFSAHDVRIPAPKRGTAAIVKRYGNPSAVILHWEDFVSIEEIIDVYLARLPYETVASDAALEAHRVIETPGAERDYDRAALEAALSE